MLRCFSGLPAYFYPTPIEQDDFSMPTYHLEMMQGRTTEQKRQLVQEVTRVTSEILGCKQEAVSIVITEIKDENWAFGGQLWADKK